MTGMLTSPRPRSLSGFASGASELIAARGAQGVGAALMTPAALSLIMTTYQGTQRARGLALWGAIGGLGIAAGVIAGGALTTWAGWQAIFWVNVPIGAVALDRRGPGPSAPASHSPAASRSSTSPARRPLVSGLGMLMFAISGTESHGWTSARTVRRAGSRGRTAHRLRPRRAALAAAAGPPPHVVDQALGVRHSRHARRDRRTRRRGLPRLDLHPDRPRLLRPARRDSASCPLAAALVVGTHVAAHVSAVTPRPGSSPDSASARPAAAPCCSPRRPSTPPTSSNLLPGLVILGLGAGMVFVAVSGSAMGGIPDEHAGMASGFMMTGHEVGAALGVAVLSAIATSAGALTTRLEQPTPSAAAPWALAADPCGLRRLRGRPDAGDAGAAAVTCTMH